MVVAQGLLERMQFQSMDAMVPLLDRLPSIKPLLSVIAPRKTHGRFARRWGSATRNGNLFIIIKINNIG